MLSKRFTTQAASVTKTSVELTRGAGKAEPMGIAGWSEVFQGSVDAGSGVPGVIAVRQVVGEISFLTEFNFTPSPQAIYGASAARC